MKHRAVVVGLWLLALAACGPTEPPTEPEACGLSTCVGCCTESGRCVRGVEVSACGAGGGVCVDCSSQGQCGLDGRCVASGSDGGTTGDGGTPPPPGCGATALSLVQGRAQVSGTTVGADKRAVGSCGGVEGGEALFAFDFPSTGSDTNVVITVTPRDAAFQPVVYLRKNRCDSSQDELPQSCVAAHLSGATVQLQTRLPAFDPATYFVVVDGQSETGGAFDLSIEVNGRAGDNCADVLALPGRQFTVRSAYAYWGDDFKLSCGSAGRRDRVYQFKTSEPAYLKAWAEDTDGDPPPVMALADNCGGQDFSCGYRLNSVQLSAGTYYLLLDQVGAAYVLRGELTAPLPGDACAQARPLVFSKGTQGGTASDSVETAGLHDDGDWGCGGSFGADLAYAFTTDQPLAFHAQATDSKGTPLPVSVVRAACTPDVRVSCNAPTLDIAELPAGSYFLWVDGLQPDSGIMRLTASLDPVASPVASQAIAPRR